jgi:chemotaxis protein MotB
MKHTLTLVALLSATACVSPEAYRELEGANNALRAENASMAEQLRALSSEFSRLKTQNEDLGRRAADAAWIEDQKKRLAELMKRNGPGTATGQNGVEVVETPDGFAFRVAGNVLFAPGQNALSENGKKTLTELSAQLKGHRLRIEGHTDDQPIQRSQWGTNLRLSAERGLVVADYLIQHAGIPADKVAVAGYGEHRPAANGADDTSRAKNRRVEIVMLR